MIFLYLGVLVTNYVYNLLEQFPIKEGTKMTNASMFTVRLRSARKSRGLSQEDLARRVNTTKSTISNYENGYSTPSNEMLLKLADVLQTTTDYLLGRTDDPNPISENETDIKKILEQKEKAHFEGHELTEEERRFISDMIRLAIRRKKDEEAATNDNA